MSTYHQIAFNTCSFVKIIKALEKSVFAISITNTNHIDFNLFFLFSIINIFEETKLKVRLIKLNLMVKRILQQIIYFRMMQLLLLQFIKRGKFL